MARIRIKGRTEEIIVDNDKARRIKARWAGDPQNNITKADRGDILDLGEWSGEYGSIRSIELDRWAPPPAQVDAAEMKKLEANVAKFEQKRIGGRLVRPFDLYCADVGVVRFDEHGSIIVKDPAGYTSACRLWQSVEALQNKRAFAKKKELEELEKGNG